MKVLQLIDVYKRAVGAQKVYDAYKKYCQGENIELDRYSIYKSLNEELNYLVEKNSNNIFIKFFQQMKGSKKLSNIILENKYDKIISFLDRSNVMAIKSSNGKCLVIATVHNPPTVQYAKVGLLRIFVFAILKHYYNKNYVHVIAVSKQVKESLELIGVKNIRIVYNPLIVNDGYVEPIKIPQPYFISVGRLSYQKAQWKLLKAVSILKSKYTKKVHLVIAGDGIMLDGTKQLCHQLRIDDLVHFTGFVDNPFPLIKNAFCMIFSSFFEGFPITVLESFYCKTPVIGTNCALPEEIRTNIPYSQFYYDNINLEENFSECIFEDDDFKLAEIMLNAVENKALLDEIAKSGNEWVLNNCSLKNFEEYK